MSNSIKILHVIYSLSGGGAERQLQLLINNAPIESIHGVFCVEPSMVDLNSWKAEFFVHQRQGKFDWSLYSRCHDTILKFQPDVVHVWLPPVISIPALLMAALQGKSVVFSYRNLMRFRRLLDLIEYCSALFFSSKVIANNPISQSVLPYRLLYRLKKGCMIPNGLDFSALGHKSHSLVKGGKSFRLIFVGRLVEQKNILNLIRALALLPREYTWQLNVYGEGNQKSQAIELASELNMMHRIAFHGFEPDIYSKIAESDLLVMPSIREGMPNVLIEAMAIGVPVVASEIMAIKDIVKSSNAVILVNPTDPKSIATGISEYFDHADFYIDNLKIGVEIASHYDASKMSARYHEEYQRIAKR